MCDYSLMHLPSRLAKEGEELFTYRFPSGATGLISATDWARISRPTPKRSPRLWQDIKDDLKRVFFRKPRAICAVCVPPGAHLILKSVLEDVQEHVIFDQMDVAVNRHRDAVRFINGRAILLQVLPAGVSVEVLSLEGAREVTPLHERRLAIR